MAHEERLIGQLLKHYFRIARRPDRLRTDECAENLGPTSFEIAVSLKSALQHILDSLLRFRPRQRGLKRSDGGEESV